MSPKNVGRWASMAAGTRALHRIDEATFEEEDLSGAVSLDVDVGDMEPHASNNDLSPRSEALGPLGSDERQEHEDTARWYRENFPPNSGAVLPCGSPSRGETIEQSSTPLYSACSTSTLV